MKSKKTTTRKPFDLERYPLDHSPWLIQSDEYRTIAEQAEKQGKRFKAKRYRKKADRAFLRAGGLILTI